MTCEVTCNITRNLTCIITFNQDAAWVAMNSSLKCSSLSQIYLLLKVWHTHAARCTLHAARCTLHAARCTLHTKPVLFRALILWPTTWPSPLWTAPTRGRRKWCSIAWCSGTAVLQYCYKGDSNIPIGVLGFVDDTLGVSKCGKAAIKKMLS